MSSDSQDTIQFDDIDVKIHPDPEPIQEPENPTETPRKKRISKRQQLISQKSTLFSEFNLFYAHHYRNIEITFAVFLFFFDIYKITVGSFLTIFTYQSCDLLMENIKCFDHPFELFALIWNCIVFVMCFVVLGYQIHREAYFIQELFVFSGKSCTIEEYLDESNNIGATDKDGKNLVEQIIRFNNHYGLCIKISTVAFLLNIIFSGISIYTFSYVGTKTATSFASNVLLLTLLLGKGVYLTYKTVDSESIVAISAYKQQPVSYNGINIWQKILDQKRRDKQQKHISALNT